MSIQFGKVVSLILLERFGRVVEKVGMYLFKYGSSPLLYIRNNTKLSLSKVKEALCILIKYRLVKFEPNRNENVANYSANHDTIFLMLRYPKYLDLIKRKFGAESEMIMEEILQKSYLTASEIIVNVVGKRKKDLNKTLTFFKIKEFLQALISAKYIIRLPIVEDEDKPVPQFISKQDELFLLPNIDLKQLNLLQNKQIKIDELIDSEIYWTVNFDRFHQDLRDQFIVNAFTQKFDENIGEFIRLLLQQMYLRTEPWAHTSDPVPINEIRDIVRKQGTHQHLIAFFDQYVDVIEQNCIRLIGKTSDCNGAGSLEIYLKEIITCFTWELIEKMILEKFDTNTARIFRLVREKEFINPDEIQKLVMIPDKQVKSIYYKLIEEHYLRMKEIRNPNSNDSKKCSFLFYIDLSSIVRDTLELCYKTLFNVMSKKNLEKSNNERLIFKRDKIDTILMGMKNQELSAEQLAEYETMITPPERAILEKIDQHLKKLNMAELKVDETIFLLDLYLIYERNT